MCEWCEFDKLGCTCTILDTIVEIEGELFAKIDQVAFHYLIVYVTFGLSFLLVGRILMDQNWCYPNIDIFISFPLNVQDI